ncbi:MAG TPA: winged helix-turn-helix transcriptional regulator [Mycobacteriales bacterium]|nr:winged helix-turn-helix transcriptional regulator [Mycobacteriales bacterium]
MKTAPTRLDAADQRTRDRVVRSLLEHGPSTATELGQRLGLTTPAIRRHLDAALEDGLIVATEERPRAPRGRGRPARRFSLSEAGHAAGPTSYDDVAVDALRYLCESAGEQAVEDFARRRMAAWEARYADRIASLPLDARAEALAAALADDGYASTVHDTTIGVQVCQHHCPVQHVAEEFPVMCEVETEAIGRLVGRHVQRLATIARGDGVCTTHIPLTDVTARQSNPATRCVEPSEETRL